MILKIHFFYNVCLSRQHITIRRDESSTHCAISIAWINPFYTPTHLNNSFWTPILGPKIDQRLTIPDLGHTTNLPIQNHQMQKQTLTIIVYMYTSQPAVKSTSRGEKQPQYLINPIPKLLIFRPLIAGNGSQWLDSLGFYGDKGGAGQGGLFILVQM